MLYRLQFAILFACILVPGSSASLRAQDAAGKARHWRVIVLIPETHLQRPRIPDPACETEICHQLIDAGFKVVDQDRVSALRYSAVEDRILTGGPQAAKDIIRLGRRFGADVLVTGRAFSEEAVQRTVQTDLGPVMQIQCRCRVEIKAIRMDTAEIIYSDAIQRTGSPEPAVELSSKACLQEGAGAICPAIIRKLDGLALSTTRYVELEARQLHGVTEAQDLEDALARVPGIVDVSPGDYGAHADQIEIKVEVNVLRTLARRLETAPSLKRFHMTVQSASNSRIIVNCK